MKLSFQVKECFNPDPQNNVRQLLKKSTLRNFLLILPGDFLCRKDHFSLST